MIIEAIDGMECEKKWIESDRNPEHLAKFLKKYPAAFYLSWVKNELARWGANCEFDNLKLLQPGRGQRKDDTGLKQVWIDFLIYRAVTELLNKGQALTGDDGIFLSLIKKPFLETYFSWERIRDRYYRVINQEAAHFIDERETLIVGPVRVAIKTESFAVGFMIYNSSEKKGIVNFKGYVEAKTE